MRKVLLPAICADIRVFCILSIASLFLGLGINRVRETPLPLVYQTKEARMMKAADKITFTELSASPVLSEVITKDIGLDEFRAIVEGKQGIIVDARPDIFYQLGHVPGAISLPRDDFENGYAKHRSRLEADKSALVAIYCSDESCEDSDLLRKALQKLGYGRTVVFKGGWSAWTEAGLPEGRIP